MKEKNSKISNFVIEIEKILSEYGIGPININYTENNEINYSYFKIQKKITGSYYVPKKGTKKYEVYDTLFTIGIRNDSIIFSDECKIFNHKDEYCGKHSYTLFLKIYKLVESKFKKEEQKLPRHLKRPLDKLNNLDETITLANSITTPE